MKAGTHSRIMEVYATLLLEEPLSPGEVADEVLNALSGFEVERVEARPLDEIDRSALAGWVSAGDRLEMDEDEDEVE